MGSRGVGANAAFEQFVEATGYVTFAELAPPPNRRDHAELREWWRFERGADWRHPLGPDSSIAGLEEHPVVHIACPDAQAFATWAGKQLPTETEWEYAARGGLAGAEYAWGDEFAPVSSASRCFDKRVWRTGNEAPDSCAPRKILKGGSFACDPSHDGRYRPAARQPKRIDCHACHIGFRCVVRLSQI